MVWQWLVFIFCGHDRPVSDDSLARLGVGSRIMRVNFRRGVRAERLCWYTV